MRALGSDPESRSLLLEALRDKFPTVRAAAVTVLRPDIPALAPSLTSLAAARPALRLLGHDPLPGQPLPPEGEALEARLRAFVRAPRPLRLDRDAAFAEALLGWLCVRLGQVHEPPPGTPAVYGEVAHSLLHLSTHAAPILIRVAMDHTELTVERSLLAVHNVIAAWRVARHLFTERDVQIWLACADVPFEDLQPPPPEEWSCGNWHAGPTFFGLRLPQGPGPALDPWVEVLTATDAAEQWPLLGEDERARVERTLAELAASPSLDPWVIVPVLGRIGHLLPAPLRSVLAERLPASLREAAEHLESAQRALGAALKPTSEPGAPPSAETSVTVRLAAGWDTFDKALATGALEDATAVLEQAATIVGPGTDAEDLDDLVRRLERLRARVRQRALAERLLKVAAALQALPLDAPAEERLGQVGYRLRLFLKG